MNPLKNAIQLDLKDAVLDAKDAEIRDLEQEVDMLDRRNYKQDSTIRELRAALAALVEVCDEIFAPTDYVSDGIRSRIENARRLAKSVGNP